jgi:hypothetical protein
MAAPAECVVGSSEATIHRAAPMAKTHRAKNETM